MSPRMARFLVVVLSPLIVLTGSGRRISPRLPAAAWTAAAAGIASGLLALGAFAMWWQPPHWGALLFFLFVGVHAIMGSVEAVVAARLLGGGAKRTLFALLGALAGHGLWAAAWFGVHPSGGELAIIVFTIIVPGAMLGACGAATAAALTGISRRSARSS